MQIDKAHSTENDGTVGIRNDMGNIFLKFGWNLIPDGLIRYVSIAMKIVRGYWANEAVQKYCSGASADAKAHIEHIQIHVCCGLQ